MVWGYPSPLRVRICPRLSIHRTVISGGRKRGYNGVVGCEDDVVFEEIFRGFGFFATTARVVNVDSQWWVGFRSDLIVPLL